MESLLTMALWVTTTEVPKDHRRVYNSLISGCSRWQSDSWCCRVVHVFKACQPTRDNAPPTAPRVPKADGTASILIANWILRNITVARCQLTVRKSTPSLVCWKTSLAETFSFAGAGWPSPNEEESSTIACSFDVSICNAGINSKNSSKLFGTGRRTPICNHYRHCKRLTMLSRVKVWSPVPLPLIYTQTVPSPVHM